MVFQIQFSVPGVHILIRAGRLLMDFSEKISRRGSFHMGHPGNPVYGSPHFQHIPAGGAAAVPMPVGEQHVPAQLLILESLITALHGKGRDHTIVGRMPLFVGLPFVRGADKVSQNLRAVHPPPFEQTVREVIVLAPPDLDRHKSVYFTLF